MTPTTLVIIVASSALVVMMGINAYFLLRFGRNKKGEQEHASILHQRLDSMSQSMQNQFEKHRDTSLSATRELTNLLHSQLKETRESTQQATLAVHQQVQGYTQGMTELQGVVKQMHESVKNVASFQDIFKAPKLRGIWGESSLEASLGQYFSRDRYEMQKYFKSGEAVDAILKLPNDLILPIDSKFNWENFEKMINADDDMTRDLHRKQFFSDVKKKIDEIASKYILPGEGTTDFALMYVPAETVYYELINNLKDADVSKYARSKKVILVSPNTFYLTVTAVHHWFRDVNVSKQTQDIIKRLSRIVQDSEKLSDEFRILGKHISNARGAYEDTEKRLGLLVERTQRVIEMKEEGEEDKTPKITS